MEIGLERLMFPFEFKRLIVIGWKCFLWFVSSLWHKVFGASVKSQGKIDHDQKEGILSVLLFLFGFL